MIPEKVLARNLDWLMESHPELNSQLKLSRVSGVGQSTVGRIRRAEVSATVDNIYRLGKPFGVTPSQMLDPRLPQLRGASGAQMGASQRAASIAAQIQELNLSEPQLTILANTLAALQTR